MEKRINWVGAQGSNMKVAYNKDEEELGNLKYERVGAHMHWCWYQESCIRMSPGCLQEVRDMQKELIKERNLLFSAGGNKND